ncbi:DUF1707 domain-containing protein [Glycomyces sp. NPDC046736]|uniref:DUF1707 SHOCT-like domain-containing protein n=1 Tax=Glycomyces sp. NPDC046736 TaxID=3155615 RepID=UPI003405EB59
MTEDHGKLRISNADREKAIEQLQAALDQGRIDLAEFDDRTRSAYEAKTNAELDLIFDDLPGGRPKVGEVEPVREEQPERGPGHGEATAHGGPHGDSGRGAAWIHETPALRGLVVVGGICTLIWLATSISSGSFDNFWPIWPILGLSIATFVQLVNRGRWH